MRDTHVSASDLGRLSRRTLPEGELASVLRHIQRCDACARAAGRSVAADLAALRGELSTDAADEHPPLDAYARGRSDAADREIVETHLEDCAECRAQLGRRRLRRRIMPYAAAAAVAAGILLAAVVFTRDDAVPPSPVEAAATPPPHAVTSAPPAPPKPVQTSSAGYVNPEWARLVARARETGRLPYPRDLATLQRGADIVRGGADPSQRVSPSGVVVAPTRPELTWPAREGGRYTVSIYEGKREVVRSPELDAPRWTPPRNLPRGVTLSWQVEVARGDAIETIPRPPAPPALFRIANASQLAEIEEARAAHPDDHLLHAVLYARAGLVDKARAAQKRADRLK